MNSLFNLPVSSSTSNGPPMSEYFTAPLVPSSVSVATKVGSNTVPGSEFSGRLVYSYEVTPKVGLLSLMSVTVMST